MIRPTTHDAFRLIFDGSRALARMEQRGFRIDAAYLDRVMGETKERIRQLEAELRKTDVYALWRKLHGGGTKLDAPRQMARVFYQELGFRPTSYTSSVCPSCKAGAGREKCRLCWGAGQNPSADEKAFSRIDHPFVRAYFEIKKLRNVVGTFLGGIWRETVDGRLHPSYRQHIAASMRSSCSLPNAQNWPRRNEELYHLVREAFVAPDGYFMVEHDFKGAEVVSAAAITGDRRLQDYVRDPSKDMHKDQSVPLFLLPRREVSKRIRDVTKNQFVFPEFYGSWYKQAAPLIWEDVERYNLKTESGASLRDWLTEKGIVELGRCQPDLDPVPGTFEELVRSAERDLWNRFSEYARWKDASWDDYCRLGYFDLVTGFRLEWGKGGLADKKQVNNYKIQGPAYHCNLWSIIQVDRWLVREKMKSHLVGEIHDSAISYVHESEIDSYLDKMQEVVEVDLPAHWDWLTVPMKIECEVAPLGGNWTQKEPWERGAGGWSPKRRAA